ncbi:phage tail sheath C-terminal domain-containing protein [Kordiimonas lacus]|uniref:Tail sheath protein C-terminal domain-containing protein n=1 Tax=Kordiimonas lacus TaxID=637679 RepID=A0A1G7A6H4_9PROT|nr:phage tail sheath C-terminal domain-containing protein [Kordiimonas lacus]SDE09655.1 hypothetical protein SAMN04488071_2082 [Kordiimonas lacus]
MAYKTPGVYVEEISTLPASVAEVETAVPAFIGYTEFATDNGVPITEPRRIKSLVEYRKYFGGPAPISGITATLTDTYALKEVSGTPKYCLFESLQMYYDNGGGDCYIVPVGRNTSGSPAKADIKAGLKKLEKVDEPTLIVFPDAAYLSSTDLTSLQVAALMQCAKLGDRFAVMDMKEDLTKEETTWESGWRTGKEDFRKNIGINNLKYGAAYTPWIQAGIERYIPNAQLTIKKGTSAIDLTSLPGADSTLVSQAIVSLQSAQAGNKKVSDVITGVDAAIQTKYLELAGKVAASTTAANAKTNFKNLLTFLGKMVGAFETWVTVDNSASSKQLSGNLLLAANAEIEDSVRDNLKTLIAYHLGAADAVIGFADAPVAADYDSKKTALGVTGAIAKNVAIFDGKTEVADKIAAAMPHMGELFSSLHGALMSMDNAGDMAETTADKTLYEVSSSYKAVIDAVRGRLNWLPPSGAIVGIYAAVDRKRGVWKAPANVSVSNAVRLSYAIDHGEQERLNVDVTAGKSINAIRSFAGKGLLVWGARTLAGNDNEWRYVPVRRFYNMVEESVKKSTGWVVFEPNDSGTWIRVKAMIDNYLTDLWRRGALAGSKPEQAFFVNVGLGTTMTPVDILEGRMIIEIGMAAVRPAEFIILRFSHKLQEA